MNLIITVALWVTCNFALLLGARRRTLAWRRRSMRRAVQLLSSMVVVLSVMFFADAESSAQSCAFTPYTCTYVADNNGGRIENCYGDGAVSCSSTCPCPSGTSCYTDINIGGEAIGTCFNTDPCAGKCGQFYDAYDDIDYLCPDACPGSQICTGQNIGGASPIQDGVCCQPTTCGAAGASCGEISSGCGSTNGVANNLYCGGCSGTATCFNNVCCTPTTCAAKGAVCGTISDGCGGTLNCGSCSGGQECTPGNTCCTPTTCAAQGAKCGSGLADQCGGTLNCGSCPAGQTCSEAFQCICSTCTSLGATCGSLSNGCGSTLDCGSCPSGETCGTSNTCCTPTTCQSQGATCGPIANGNCGNTVFCGYCPTNEHCNTLTHQCAAGGPVPAMTSSSNVGLGILLAIVGLTLVPRRRRS